MRQVASDHALLPLPVSLLQLGAFLAKYNAALLITEEEVLSRGRLLQEKGHKGTPKPVTKDEDDAERPGTVRKLPEQEQEHEQGLAGSGVLVAHSPAQGTPERGNQQDRCDDYGLEQHPKMKERETEVGEEEEEETGTTGTCPDRLANYLKTVQAVFSAKGVENL